MKQAQLAWLGVVGLSLAVSGCVDHGPPEVVFESVDVPGVTTDHASTGGVAWVDYDADGDLDLFVTNGYDVSASEPMPQPNRLYRNDGTGTFEAVIQGAVVEVEAVSSGNTWADFDNDGDPDVFVANQQDQDNLLFRNDGSGTFVRIEDEPPARDGGHSYAAGWVDVDNDGLVDLFVANGGLSHSGPNRLYRNLGDGHFEPVTGGSIATDDAPTCGFAWGDYDNDGDADLFVANQGFNPATNGNALYRNDGSWTFTRIVDSPAVIGHAPSAAVNWVDIDNDLDLDLHVTNLYGLADSLYRNDGRGGLEPVPDSPLSLDSSYAFEANWEDYDNDGDIDVVVANWGGGATLYRNDGTGRFRRSDAGDLTERMHHAGTMASADYDSDGDIDVLIGNWPNGPGPDELNRLYRNRGNDHHWIAFRLAGTKSNRSAIGARVTVVSRDGTGDVARMREIGSHTGFRGQSASIAHFGLGEATAVVTVEVRWPSGARSTVVDPGVDRLHDIVEP